MSYCLQGGGRSSITTTSRSIAQVKVYSLEEIVAEKLRALLQQAEMIREARLESLTRPRLLRPLASARDLRRPDEPGELRLAAT